jgi:copper(I)-binding protein
MTMHLLAVLLVMAIALAGCGGGGSNGMPEISNARIGQPTGPNAAFYFTASGYGEDDNLVAASTDVAESVELHETVMGDDGTMGMQPVDRLELPADGTLVLEPGGYHIMLIGADRLDVGSTVEVALQWEKAGEEKVEAEVVEPSETMGEGGSQSTASSATMGPTTTTAQIDVVVEGEAPDLVVNGPEEFDYHVGDTVHITVLSSVGDEVHVHGYDLKFDAEAGVPLVIEFTADVQGIFEVELESAGFSLFNIRVDP